MHFFEMVQGGGREGDTFAEWIELACTSLKANPEKTQFSCPLQARGCFWPIISPDPDRNGIPLSLGSGLCLAAVEKPGT